MQKGLQIKMGSRTTVESKIVAQEMLMTSAGAFDTFKIESHRKTFDTADPSRSGIAPMSAGSSSNQLHRVRRTFLTKTQNRTTEQTSDDLADPRKAGKWSMARRRLISGCAA